MKHPFSSAQVIRRLSPLLLGLLVGACGGSSPTGLSEPSPVEVEHESAQAVNAARQSNGLQLLEPEWAKVQQVAREYSEEMREQGFLGHVDPNGRDLEQRLRDAGIPFSLAGENLAKIAHSGDPAAAAHAGFMKSPAHRHNILDQRFEMVAVGVAEAGDTFWFTQIFLCP